MQRSELVELPDTTEVEERVAVNDAGDVPESDSEREPEEGHPERVPGGRSRRDAQRERQRRDTDPREHDQRDPDRRVNEEDDEQRRNERRQRPGNGRRGAAQPQRTGDERARKEQDER